MGKRLTKIIIIGMLIVMSLGIFAGCGSYEYNQDDFKLTIEVDKTEVQIGDTITVTAKLENLSGRDIRVQMSHARYKELKDMLLIGLFDENEEHYFNVTSESGTLKKMSFKKNEIIVRTVELVIDENRRCELAAAAVFNIGNDYKKTASVYSESIKIIIKEND